MKLIVQIPCFNEETSLENTIRSIPRDIAGIDNVEILIVDDGSTDATVDVAHRCGVNYIVKNKVNKGLARSFRIGIDACLKLEADIIVNMDGDFQYTGVDIPRLIAPILSGEADIVVGDRNTDTIEQFSGKKKFLQKVGSAIVRNLSGTDIPDAVSGFRAISKEAALQMNIISPFSYTVEMIIQAGKKHIALVSVPAQTNPVKRRSRLAKNTWKFVEQQLITMVRMYAMYQPLRVFFYIGVILSMIGAVPVFRFVYYYITGNGDGHIQSLILGGILLMMGFVTFLIGLVADLISFNRQLIEMAFDRVRRLDLKDSKSNNKPDE